MKIMPIAAFACCVITFFPQPSHAQSTLPGSATTAPDTLPLDLNALYPPLPDREKINAQLDQPINDFKMSQQPFGQAIDKLRAASKLNLNVNWTAIQGAGVDLNTPVTVDLQNPTCRTVLSTLLASVGGGQSNLGYTIHDGAVRISTKDELQSAPYQVTREYDIDPLIRWVIKVRGVTIDDAIKELTSEITSTVAADTWRDAGGTIGSLREVHHTLTINQTEDNQEAIRQLLISKAARAIPITRVYDVRSFVADPDKAQSTQHLMELEGVIRDHCPPDTWGNDGAMTARNGFLIISANALSQSRISALLDAVRKIDAQNNAPPK